MGNGQTQEICISTYVFTINPTQSLDTSNTVKQSPISIKFKLVFEISHI
jgi:hypothetical protein